MQTDNSPRQDVEPADRRTRRTHHARYSPAAWLLLLATVVLGVSIDLLSKHLAFQHVHDHPITITPEHAANPATDPTRLAEPMLLLPGDLLALRLTLNRGAVFGFGENQRFFFILFTIGACIGAVYVFGTKTRAYHRMAHVAIGLLLAGAIGNFYDRLAFHAVRDFIQIMPGRMLPDGMTWPGGNPEMFPWVFNIADVLLLVGVLWLMTHIRIKRTRRARRKQTLAAAESVPST